jgi:type II secretory pathway pseudopilin PulG
MMTSGLEMTIIGAIVGGVASIASGIMGSSAASKANADAKKAQKKQEKLAQEQADITNEYNTKAFEAEKKDYYAQREFQWDTLQREYQYNNTIVDFRYLQDVRMYGKSVNTYKDTLAFNSIAAQQAYEGVQAQLNELRQGDAFAKQDMLVERLMAEGEAATGQAGRSQMKAQQVTVADQGRSLAVMREELRSADRNASAAMFDTGLQKYGADLNARANLMLRPDRMPEPLQPVMGPERTFVAPPKALPGFVPPAVQQSTAAPLVSGIGSGLSGILGAIKF